MKKIYTLLGLFLIFVYSYGQSASNYSFTAVQGSYIPLTGVPGVTDTSLNATDDNAISNAVTLPFTFTFAGVAYTSIRVSSNGFLSFSAAATDSNANTQANAEITQLNSAEQVLLVKIFLENDHIETRKIIFR